MENSTRVDTLDLEVLESRLEMESVVAMAAPQSSPTVPISHCEYDF